MNETFFFQDEKISLKIFRQDEKDCFELTKEVKACWYLNYIFNLKYKHM